MKFRKNFIYIFIILGLIFNFSKNFNRISDKDFVNNPYLEISNKIVKSNRKFLGDFTYYQGWYGKNPIGSQELFNKEYKKIFLFKILYNKN